MVASFISMRVRSPRIVLVVILFNLVRWVGRATDPQHGERATMYEAGQ